MHDRYPEQQLLDQTVTQAILPAHDGQIGILTSRAPLLVKLGLGKLQIDLAGGKRQTYLVDGGIAQMKDNKLTVLTSAAWARRTSTPPPPGPSTTKHLTPSPAISVACRIASVS